MGVRSVEELLNFVPGFQSSRETFLNQGYRVGARGLLTPQPSYSILFLIDGQRLNSDMSGGALVDNRYITTANIESIEIIRGPGSALYGSSAFSGVVNIKTIRNTNNIYAAAGSLGSKQIHANGNIKFNKWQAPGFLRIYKDNGDKYGAELTNQINPLVDSTQDPYESRDFNASVNWNKRIKIDLRHASRILEDFFSFKTVENNVTQAKTENNHLVISAALITQPNWGMDAKLSYSAWHEQQIEYWAANLGVYHFDSNETAFRLNWHLMANNHEIRAGLNYRKPKITHYSFDFINSNDSIPQGPTSGRTLAGLYLQDQFKLASKLSATMGLRLDYTSNLNDKTDLSPRLALVYQPQKDSSYKLMYGEAFRAPNRFQTSDIFIGKLIVFIVD